MLIGEKGERDVLKRGEICMVNLADDREKLEGYRQERMGKRDGFAAGDRTNGRKMFGSYGEKGVVKRNALWYTLR